MYHVLDMRAPPAAVGGCQDRREGASISVCHVAVVGKAGWGALQRNSCLRRTKENHFRFFRPKCRHAVYCCPRETLSSPVNRRRGVPSKKERREDLVVSGRADCKV